MSPYRRTALRKPPVAAGDRERLDRATAALDPPFAVLDLDAFDAQRRRPGAPRGGQADPAGFEVRALPRADRARARAGLRGMLAFTLPEALWLAGDGHDDLVVAYPTVDRAALRALADGEAARARHGDGRLPEHLDLRRGRARPGGRRCAFARRRRGLVAARRARPDRRQALAAAHARAGGRARARDRRAAGAARSTA